MQVSEKIIEEFQEIYKKKEGKELGRQEAYEQAQKLIGFVELLWECGKKDAEKKRRLKKEPNGFPVDGNYSCLICGNGINPQTGWYDKYGPKCLLCQKALNNGDIPTYVCVNRDSYFKVWKLADAFKVRTVTIRKMVREGKLKSRDILNEEGKIYEQIFLKKENPTLVERYSSARKSYDRNRNKVSEKWSREQKKKLIEEYRKKNKKQRFK